MIIGLIHQLHHNKLTNKQSNEIQVEKHSNKEMRKIWFGIFYWKITWLDYLFFYWIRYRWKFSKFYISFKVSKSTECANSSIKKNVLVLTDSMKMRALCRYESRLKQSFFPLQEFDWSLLMYINIKPCTSLLSWTCKISPIKA